MKARDQGEMIREGSDYLTAITSKRKDRGHIVIDERFDEDEVDEDYKAFLFGLGVLEVAGKEKKVDKGSKREIDPDEELREYWLTVEKALNASDSDEEIQGDRLTRKKPLNAADSDEEILGDRLAREKPLNASESDEEIQGDGLVAEEVLNAADCDVPAEEVGSRKGVDADEGETGSDDCDPDYMMFYRGLKPRGTAYVLEVARGNGLEIIKYEEKDEDEFPSSGERKRKVSNPVGRPRRDRSSDGLQREMENRETGCAKLKRHGNLPQPPSDERKRKVSNPVGRPPLVRGSNGSPRQSGKGERNKELESVHIQQLGEDDESYSVFLRGRKSSGNLLQQCSKGERDKESKRFQIPHNDEIDKHYCLFLRGLKIFGGSFVYEDKDAGIQYRYDELTDESASDSDSEVSTKPPPSSNKRLASSGKRVPSNQSVERSTYEFKKMTPEPSNKRLTPSGKRVPSNQTVERPSSEFRQGVTDILLKPYSKREHDDLLKAAVLRKPQVHFHETRNRSTPYYDHRTKGKSFLDHHIDLKKKIKAVQHDDPPKALQLLRGLFFYLTHVCMVDHFKPWNDDKWLEAMNRSTSQRHH